MSENVEDAVPQILVKIQEDIAAFRRDVTGRFDRIEDRLDRVETIQKQERRNTATLLVMMRNTAGVHGERITRLEIDRIVKLEDRMTALERRLT
jgi:hypothetical protein